MVSFCKALDALTLASNSDRHCMGEGKMFKKHNIKLIISMLAGLVIMMAGMSFLYISSASKTASASLVLRPNDMAVIKKGKSIYAENCASCHGVNFEGQANWRIRDADGFLPAPPHDETGHTWHHPDSYLFLMTKYGIEEMIGRPYPNHMPAYQDRLTDDEIIAALSYIKSRWPRPIQRQHDQINARAKGQ